MAGDREAGYIQRRRAGAFMLVMASVAMLHGGKGPPKSPGDLIRSLAEGGAAATQEGGRPQRDIIPGAPARVVFQSEAAGWPAYPFGPAGAPGATVRAVILTTGAVAADLATLVDAPETARIRTASGGGAMPVMTAAEASLSAQFMPGRWQVLEIDFEDPVPLEALAFGNTAGRAGWSRHWRGAIGEIVCLDAPPSAAARAGIANYLAIKGGFTHLGYRATHEQRQAAIETGLEYGVAWGTAIMLR